MDSSNEKSPLNDETRDDSGDDENALLPDDKLNDPGTDLTNKVLMKTFTRRTQKERDVILLKITNSRAAKKVMTPSVQQSATRQSSVLLLRQHRNFINTHLQICWVKLLQIVVMPKILRAL